MERRDEILYKLANNKEATDIITVEFTLLWEELQQLEKDMYPENTNKKGECKNETIYRKQNRRNKNE